MSHKRNVPYPQITKCCEFRAQDVGCGVGGPAREIARFSGCHVTGLNNNDYQIERCAHYAASAGLDSQWTGHKGNFMKMDFTDNS